MRGKALGLRHSSTDDRAVLDAAECEIGIEWGSALEQGQKLVDRESGLSDNRPLGSARQLGVIGNDQSSIGWVRATQDYVTSPLSVDHESCPLERPDRFASREDRQSRHLQFHDLL